MKKTGIKPPEGLAPRVTVTVAGGSVVLITVLLVLAFHETGFSTFQNVAALLVAFLAVFAAMVLIWVPWGIENAPQLVKWGEAMDSESRGKKHGRFEKPPEGTVFRTQLSTIVSTLILCIIILFLAFTDTGFSLFQNVAVVLVAFIIMGAAMSLIWTPMMGCCSEH